MRSACLTALLCLAAPLLAQGSPAISDPSEVPAIEHTGISNFANPRLTLINWENQIPFGHERDGNVGSSIAAARRTETAGASSRTAREANLRQAQPSSQPAVADQAGKRGGEGYVRLGTNESGQASTALRRPTSQASQEPVSSRTPPWSANNNSVAVSETPGTDIPTPLVVLLVIGGIVALYLLKNSLLD